ncbi:phosphopyruvate hydratase [Patescibacteria group bacterium]|nr:phosphopyruvate hydratase [Patescibacteria group bacterium]
MSKIAKIHALEILDSRGYPTIKAKVFLENGSWGCASVPAGASKGKAEATELRDGDDKRYQGKGVKKAISLINTRIHRLLKETDINLLREIDQKMIESDGTKTKSDLGANTTLAVSLACARAGALANGKSLHRHIREVYNLGHKDYQLPLPMMNVINGGLHADNRLNIQEYMIVPKADKYPEIIRYGAEVFHKLKDILKAKGKRVSVGDEGGYAPDLDTNEEPFVLISEAISQAGLTPGEDVTLAIDAAADNFFNSEQNKYFLDLENSSLSSDQLAALYADWASKYPIVSIEDGLAEEDFAGWSLLQEKLGKNLMIVGDDLFVTSQERLKIGIAKQLANAIIIKPNQIGTLTETIDCVRLAQANKIKTIVAHRSGDTCDSFIADLAIAVKADFIKTGSLCRSERLAKYNRLLEIEEELSADEG